jgi:undecaprenyl-diphosphatase
MFEIIKALILGIIEGFTEFLPISSTGHLIVAEKIVNFHDRNEIFTVVVQLGAIAAVIWYYREDLWNKTVGLFRREKSALAFWKILVIGTIPGGLLGLLLDSSMGAIAIPFFVAVSLIIGGVVLWFVDNKPVGRNTKTEISEIKMKQAILVGLGQSIAIIPGVSRSGASIVSGLMVGLNRSTATAFSFYLSIPIMVVASGYKLVKYGSEIGQITGGWLGVLVGAIAAFITALLAIKWLLGYIARHNFRLFAIYRIGFGLFLLLLIAMGVLI